MPVPRYNNELWYHFSEVEQMIDKAIADEREAIIEEGERIYDQFVREGGASPSLKAKGVGTFIQAIRNRGKE